MTIEAWNRDSAVDNEVIDVFAQSIIFLQNIDRQMVIESGVNGIVLLNLSYYIQQWYDKYTSKCDTEIAASSVINQQVTSTPADACFTPTDNSTDEQVQESSSSPWTWIAVAILFMLLTILFFIISIALTSINKKTGKKIRVNKKGGACEDNGR